MINKKLRFSSTKKVVLGLVVGVLALSSIVLTVETATGSAEVSKLNKEEKQYIDQKRLLENTLVSTMSVSKLEEKSADLGYARPESLMYITPSEAVAKLP